MRLLTLLLLLTPVALAWGDEEQKPDPQKLLAEARSHVEADRPRKAFAVFQQLIATKDHAPSVFVEAANAAFDGALYKDAVKVVQKGSEALKKIKPVTDLERGIRKDLKAISTKAKRELKILKQIPGISGYLLKYVRSWEMIPRCKELGEPDYSGDEGSTQPLDAKYQGRHLEVELKRVPPNWAYELWLLEGSPEQKTAEARFEKLLAQIRSHKRAYIKDAQVKRKLERMTLHERKPKLLEKTGSYLEVKRIDFEWGGDARVLKYKRLGFISLWRMLDEGHTQPADEAWWMVAVYIDGHWFTYDRTK